VPVPRCELAGTGMALDFIALLPDEEIPETPAACEAASSSDTGEPAPDAWSITRAHFGADSLELALHEELLDFAEAFRPTRAESAMREAAVERVVSLLASLPSFASASVRPFGSYATGLCLPSSDVDLAVFGTGFESKVQQVAGLRQIEKALHRAGWRAEEAAAARRWLCRRGCDSLTAAGLDRSRSSAPQRCPSSSTSTARAASRSTCASSNKTGSARRPWRPRRRASSRPSARSCCCSSGTSPRVA